MRKINDGKWEIFNFNFFNKRYCLELWLTTEYSNSLLKNPKLKYFVWKKIYYEQLKTKKETNIKFINFK